MEEELMAEELMLIMSEEEQSQIGFQGDWEAVEVIPEEIEIKKN